MKGQLIDQTDRYRFERIKLTTGFKGESELATRLSTTYVHDGQVDLYLQTKDGRDDHVTIQSGQGFIIAPGTTYRMDNLGELVAYTVSSEVDTDSPIMEIIDDGTSREEVPIEGYRIVTEPKRVEKPWGHELWVSWFKDYHVLKQIGMNAGNQSSLQFHREKLETNYLEWGQADVIDGYKLDPQAPEEEVQASSKGVDFDEHKKTMNPGNHWTSHPGTVHRVIARQDYLAYEVSTPELDDVIRLKDDSGRQSGRIASEHKGGAGK